MTEWTDEVKKEQTRKWLDKFKKERKIFRRIFNMIVSFVIAFLIGVIVWAAASAIRDIRAKETKDTIIVELEHVSDHRVFYDTETGVMYVEYSSHGGISPMYNPDGSLRVYKE